MQLHDRVCLITGGTSGIGAAVCHDLLANGADVVAVGRTERVQEERQLQQTAGQLQRRFEVVHADISNQAGCIRAAQHAFDLFGRVDVLVHSAGGAWPGSVLEVSVEDWMAAFAVHVHAIFHLVRSIAPFMQEHNEGAVV